MRGLAEASKAVPETKPSRKIRLHYGTQAWDTYEESKHEYSRSIADGLYGGRTIQIMNWFINKGSEVEESRPVEFQFYKQQLVSRGRPSKLGITVYSCDSNARQGPAYCTKDVIELVTLEADLSSEEESNFPRQVGKDGREYYVMRFIVEVTYLSGQTKYVLVFQDKRYNTVRTYD